MWKKTKRMTDKQSFLSLIFNMTSHADATSRKLESKTVVAHFYKFFTHLMGNEIAPMLIKRSTEESAMLREMEVHLLAVERVALELSCDLERLRTARGIPHDTKPLNKILEVLLRQRTAIATQGSDALKPDDLEVVANEIENMTKERERLEYPVF